MRYSYLLARLCIGAIAAIAFAAAAPRASSQIVTPFMKVVMLNNKCVYVDASADPNLGTHQVKVWTCWDHPGFRFDTGDRFHPKFVHTQTGLCLRPGEMIGNDDYWAEATTCPNPARVKVVPLANGAMIQTVYHCSPQPACGTYPPPPLCLYAPLFYGNVPDGWRLRFSSNCQSRPGAVFKFVPF